MNLLFPLEEETVRRSARAEDDLGESRGKFPAMIIKTIFSGGKENGSKDSFKKNG